MAKGSTADHSGTALAHCGARIPLHLQPKYTPTDRHVLRPLATPHLGVGARAPAIGSQSAAHELVGPDEAIAGRSVGSRRKALLNRRRAGHPTVGGQGNQHEACPSAGPKRGHQSLFIRWWEVTTLQEHDLIAALQAAAASPAPAAENWPKRLLGDQPVESCNSPCGAHSGDHRHRSDQDQNPKGEVLLDGSMSNLVHCRSLTRNARRASVAQFSIATYLLRTQS